MKGKESTAVLVEKYKTSVTQAFETICPCGHDSGKKLRELGYRNIYWLATRKTKVTHSPEFRAAVRAARIIRAHRAEEKDLAAGRAEAPKQLDSAKKVLMQCVRCSQQVYLSRFLTARRRCRCLECGGQLEAAHRAVDEHFNTREAAEYFGLTIHKMRDVFHHEYIVKQKIGSRWVATVSSIERALQDIRNRKEERERGVEVQRGFLCPICKERFRSRVGLKLHVKERHEDF